VELSTVYIDFCMYIYYVTNESVSEDEQTLVFNWLNWTIVFLNLCSWALLCAVTVKKILHKT